MKHIIPICSAVLVISVSSLVIYTEINRDSKTQSPKLLTTVQTQAIQTTSNTIKHSAYTNNAAHKQPAASPGLASNAADPQSDHSQQSRSTQPPDTANYNHQTESIPGLDAALAQASNHLEQDELSELFELFARDDKLQEQQAALKKGLSSIISAAKLGGIESDRIEHLSSGIQQTIAKHVGKYKQSFSTAEGFHVEANNFQEAILEDLNKLAQDEFGASIEDLAQQLQDYPSDDSHR